MPDTFYTGVSLPPAPTAAQMEADFQARNAPAINASIDRINAAITGYDTTMGYSAPSPAMQFAAPSPVIEISAIPQAVDVSPATPLTNSPVLQSDPMSNLPALISSGIETVTDQLPDVLHTDIAPLLPSLQTVTQQPTPNLIPLLIGAFFLLFR